MACLRVQEAGAPEITDRLKRQFVLLGLAQPTDVEARRLFGAILEGRFRGGPQPSGLASDLAAATLGLLGRARAALTPTLAKPHYQFSLHDAARLVQGMMHACDAAWRADAGYLVRLWAHEAQRVLCDKLATPADREWMLGCIRAEARALGQEPDAAERFGAWRGGDEGARGYLASPQSLAAAREGLRRLVQAQRPPSGRAAGTELVLFDDALEHALRLCRVLGMERGSALLVGVGGSGKQSLARLAASVAGLAVFSITLTKQYSTPYFLEDLKTLCKTLLLKAQPVCFLLVESDIRDLAFLQYLNQLLVTGNIPDLFPRDELDTLLSELRPAMKAAWPRACFSGRCGTECAFATGM